MWENTKRMSSSSSNTGDGLYEKLERVKREEKEGKDLNESFPTLNLDFDWQDQKASSESPQTLSLTEGFEMQDTIGGHCENTSPVVSKTSPLQKNPVIQRAVTSTSLAESSASSEDEFVVAENSPLVKI